MNLTEAIFERHSVRDYLDMPLAGELVSVLKERIKEVNAESGLHVQLVVDEPLAFKGIRSYGKFHGVSDYIVMAGRRTKDLDQLVGYYGEQLVLYAQTLGLNTCWVGMTHGKTAGAFHLEADEKVACVIAVGYGATQGVRHKIKTVDQVSNASSNTPAWFRQGVEAALLAPTAVNQQKFSFDYLGQGADGKGIVRLRKGFSVFGYTRMDSGIARLHFELGAGVENFVWSED